MMAMIPAGVALSDANRESHMLRKKILGAVGLVMGMALVGVALEVGLIILRFLNIGIINYKIKWLLVLVRDHHFIILCMYVCMYLINFLRIFPNQIV